MLRAPRWGFGLFCLVQGCAAARSSPSVGDRPTSGAASASPGVAPDAGLATSPGSSGRTPAGKSADADGPVDAGAGNISRRDLIAVLSPGLGPFLQAVQVEPRVVGGKFVGWRIVRFRRPGPFADLEPGDVVASVNGRSIERPEQALEVWQSLALANELRIDYERGGIRRTFVRRVVDLPPPATNP